MNFNEIAFFVNLAETASNRGSELINEELKDMQVCDYEKYSAFFSRNNYAPYLYYNYQRNSILKIFPEEFAEILKNEFTKNSFRNLKLRNVYIEIANKLHFEHIDFILLKGIDLQHRLYAEPNLRPMIDIDILVKPENVFRATEIILQLGAKQVLVSETPFIDSLKHHASPLVYKEVAIEIHRKLLDDYDLATFSNIDVWDETESTYIEGIEVNVMKPELLLVYLCHHLYNTISGGKIKLIAFLDVFKLLANYSNKINNEKLKEITQTAKVELSLYQTLAQTKKLFPSINIPKSIINEVNEVKVNENLLLSALMQNNRLFNRAHYLKKFSKIEGFGYKLKYLRGKLFPSKEFLVQKYKVKSRLILFILTIIYPIYFLVQVMLSFFSYLSKILTFK